MEGCGIQFRRNRVRYERLMGLLTKHVLAQWLFEVEDGGLDRVNLSYGGFFSACGELRGLWFERLTLCNKIPFRTSLEVEIAAGNQVKSLSGRGQV